MSMGGCYISVKQKELDSIIASNQSLSDFIFGDNKIDTYSVEQAWDALRCLFEHEIPDILGCHLLEQVDLGEACYILDTSELLSLQKQMEDITLKDFTQMYNSSSFQGAEFYWDNLWKSGNLKLLYDFFEGLKNFISTTLKNKNILLFYIC